MRRPQPHQHVNMVTYPTDRLRHPARGTHGATQIGVEAIPPRLVNKRATLFSAEDNVVMEAQVC